jgi:glycine cleavage system regulatory protein
VNRQEAIGVLREALEDCSDFIRMDFVSITDSTAQIRMKSTGYELYIKCAPSNGLKQCLTPVLETHQLKMAELKDAIIIYKPK